MRGVSIQTMNLKRGISTQYSPYTILLTYVISTGAKALLSTYYGLAKVIHDVAKELPSCGHLVKLYVFSVCDSA